MPSPQTVGAAAIHIGVVIQTCVALDIVAIVAGFKTGFAEQLNPSVSSAPHNADLNLTITAALPCRAVVEAGVRLDTVPVIAGFSPCPNMLITAARHETVGQARIGLG